MRNLYDNMWNTCWQYVEYVLARCGGDMWNTRNTHQAPQRHKTQTTLLISAYALHPTLCTLQPAPYALRPTFYTLHPTLYTLHPTPYTPNAAKEYSGALPDREYRRDRTRAHSTEVTNNKRTHSAQRKEQVRRTARPSGGRQRAPREARAPGI